VTDAAADRSAVLFLIFNRPEVTARVFEAIRAARPPRLYVAADGPRPGRPEDVADCAKARAIALATDWPCEVHTLLREENLGCRRAVEEALDWFFAAEEAGIVLEDDCVPGPTFFPFCDLLLARYRDDARVFSISGSNFQNERHAESYYFSKHFHCWGWASWRRAWQRYRDHAGPQADALSQGLARLADGSRWFAPYWLQVARLVQSGRVDSWAYRVSLWCFSRAAGEVALHVIPDRNLVINIGLGGGGTHAHGAAPEAGEAAALAFPLRHPPLPVRDTTADRHTDRVHFGIAFLPFLRRRIALGLPSLERF
jgi:hypothetical protein